MPFIPLRDSTPRILIARPYVTWGIAVLCTLLFLATALGSPGTLELVFYSLGLIPAVFTGTAELSPEIPALPSWLTLFTSMFLHGSLMHLVGNMLFLLVFGDNVEDSMGHRRFLMFYLICGVAAALAHIAIAPASTTPMVGASGAISGILGAYLVLHPKANVMILIFWLPFALPAWLLLVFWIGFQVLSAVSAPAAGSGVAWWAHIGGFAAGALLIPLFRHGSIPLWGGGDDLPKGLTLRAKARRKGPWTR